MSVRVQREISTSGPRCARSHRGSHRYRRGTSPSPGYMRSDNDGASVTAMTLEHYPGMTEAELVRVEEEARRVGRCRRA